MRTSDVELLAVSDDGPVNGCLRTEDTELYEGTELSDDRKTLTYTCRITGCFNINVTAISIGKGLDFFINIALSRIEYEVCAEFLCFFQTVLLHIEHDKELRVLHSCVGDHAKAEGACAGDDNDIFVCDLCAVYCVLGAAERLDQKRLLNTHFFRNACDDASLAIAYVLSHTTIVVVLVAVHVMRLAHPVMSVLTETAFATRYDLVCGDAVAELIFGHIFTELYDASKELMPRNKRRLYPCRLHFIAPEHCDAVLAFQVACAYTTTFYFNNDVIRSALRCRVLRLKTVISASICYECFHCFWNRSSYCHFRFLPLL